jgi:hypothetical protein
MTQHAAAAGSTMQRKAATTLRLISEALAAAGIHAKTSFEMLVLHLVAKET